MNHIYIKSPEQNAIMARLGSLTNITYIDERLAAHTIALSVFQEAQHHRASIIVTKDSDTKSMIWEYLRDMGIQHLAHECSINDCITDADVNDFRHFLSRNYAVPWEEFQEAKFRFDIADYNIKEYYLSSQGIDKTGFQFGRVLEKYLLLPRHTSIQKLQLNVEAKNIPFEIQHYKRLIKQLQEVSPYYQVSFELIDNQPYQSTLKTTQYLTENIHEASYNLSSLREECDLLYQQYVNKMLSIKESFLNEKYVFIADISETVQLVCHKLNILNQKIALDDSKKGFLTLLRKEDLSLSEIKRQIEIDIRTVDSFLREHNCNATPILMVDIFDPDKLKHWSLQVNEYIKLVENKLTPLADEYIKSINKLNFLDPSIGDLEDFLQVMIQKCNDSNLLAHHLELNTLSFMKQCSFLESILHDIDILILNIDINLPYFQWLSKLREMDDDTILLIDHLRGIDSNQWVEIINHWYYYNVLYRQSARTHHVSHTDLITSVDLYHSTCQLQAQNIVNVQSPLLGKDWTKELKKYFPNLHTSIVKNRPLLEKITWSSLIEILTEFMFEMYPILIVDSDNFRSFASPNLSNIFYIQSSSTNPDILHYAKTVHTYISASTQIGIETGLRLSTFRIGHSSLMPNVPVARRAVLARQLASLMMAAHQRPRIFQLRYSSVIFYGYDFIAQRLANELYHYGIKEVMIEQSVEQTIAAAWLSENAAPIVIIENNLINHHNSDNYLWQLSVLETLKGHGANILNLDLNILWKDGISLLVDNVLKEIKRANPLRQELQNQLSIEF